ncbi:MAG: hypothetical protein K0S65_1759, partial [Labilithrix sp.]|nr:hypothetical protein [Labilithrix sp.]
MHTRIWGAELTASRLLAEAATGSGRDALDASTGIGSETDASAGSAALGVATIAAGALDAVLAGVASRVGHPIAVARTPSATSAA